MPRRPRMYIPGFPYHIVQRGNNRKACFLDQEHFALYLELWKEISARYGVAVHAYCLMTNHIHFLVTPETQEAVSNTMKVIGSRYAYYFNKQLNRTGTLWEGRHKASLIQSERYLLTCYRYIELNPVRACMVSQPEEYHWSSHGINAWGDNGWLKSHQEYLKLGHTKEERCRVYRKLFRDQIDAEDLHLIRKAAHYCQPVSDERFLEELADRYGLEPGQMFRGRPRKPGKLYKK
ncbi:MAG: transposase [Gammaproteobacteria bacterium]